MAEEAKKIEEDKAIVENTGDKTTENAVNTAKDGENEVETLKKKLAEANTRALHAEMERDERKASEETARKEAKTNEDVALKAQEDAIISGVSAAKSDFEKTQQKLRDALDSGEKEAILTAQIELNDSQAKLRGAEYQKNSFEAYKEKQKSFQNTTTASSGGEKYTVKTASGQNLALTKLERDFIVNKFPDVLTDADAEDDLYDADRKAKRAGYKGGTQEYVDAVEATMNKKGYGKKEETGSTGDKPKSNGVDKDAARDKQQRFNAQSTAAPANGGSGTASMTRSTGNKTVISLTSAQKEAAEVCYPELYRKDPAAAELKYMEYQKIINKEKGN